MKRVKSFEGHVKISKRSSGSAKRSKIKTSSMNKHKRRQRGLQHR